MKHKVIKCQSPIFPFRVVFVIGKKPSHKEWTRYARKAHGYKSAEIRPIKNTTAALTSMMDGTCCIWVPSLKKRDMGKLFHELIHASCEFSRKTGCPLNDYGDECTAYFMEWVVNELFRKASK